MKLDRQIVYVAIVTVYSMLITLVVCECAKRLHTRPTEIPVDAGLVGP